MKTKFNTFYNFSLDKSNPMHNDNGNDVSFFVLGSPFFYIYYEYYGTKKKQKNATQRLRRKVRINELSFIRLVYTTYILIHMPMTSCSHSYENYLTKKLTSLHQQWLLFVFLTSFFCRVHFTDVSLLTLFLFIHHKMVCVCEWRTLNVFNMCSTTYFQH